MGVADGVYAWKEQGIDSGAMSRSLMETAQHMVQAGCQDVLKGGGPGGVCLYGIRGCARGRSGGSCS
jgi:protein phosphatase PTC7